MVGGEGKNCNEAGKEWNACCLHVIRVQVVVVCGWLQVMESMSGQETNESSIGKKEIDIMHAFSLPC